jgi:hypothetical protein
VSPSTMPRMRASSSGSNCIAAYSKRICVDPGQAVHESTRDAANGCRRARGREGRARRIAAPLDRADPLDGEALPADGPGHVAHLRRRARARAPRARRGLCAPSFGTAAGMVDSSPMYGEAESLVGEEYARIGKPRPPVLGERRCGPSVGSLGAARWRSRARLWGLTRLDLMSGPQHARLGGAPARR